MKKHIFLMLTSLAFACALSAQELVSKKGEPFLPEEGDWAIGIDAAPFLYYIGNTFNNTSNNAPSWSYIDQGMSIYGKYFKAADFAYRARLRLLGINNHTDAKFALNDDPNAEPLSTVKDEKSHSELQVALGFGFEKRRGKTRLQGFYGAEVMLMVGSSSDEYTYGNAISSSNNTPSTSDFGDNLITGSYARITKRDFGTMFSANLRPFIGAEYFILPKISLAGEFGINIGITTKSETEVTAENWNATDGVVQELKFNEDTGGITAFQFDNSNLSGALRLMFHF